MVSKDGIRRSYRKTQRKEYWIEGRVNIHIGQPRIGGMNIGQPWIGGVNIDMRRGQPEKRTWMSATEACTATMAADCVAMAAGDAAAVAMLAVAAASALLSD